MDVAKARIVVAALPLPSHSHIPGMNPRHEEGFLDPIIAMAPARTQSASAAANVPWLYGLRLLRLGYFWEAHEVWEAVWMRAAPNSREKRLLQGMIHIANAALKRKMAREKAAERLEALADSALAEVFPPGKPSPCMGLDPFAVAELRREIDNRH